MNISLESQIESILFWKGEPVTITDISKILEVSEDEIKNSIEQLKLSLSGRGVQIVSNGDEVTLSTHPEMHSFIEELNKAEMSKDLSKPALETLSIIIYKGPVTRSEIDYIRGVNSQFIIRTLLVRGLITRVDNPKDERSFLYKASIELLQLLGVGSAEDMPEFDNVKSQVDAFISAKQDEELENDKDTGSEE